MQIVITTAIKCASAYLSKLPQGIQHYTVNKHIRGAIFELVVIGTHLNVGYIDLQNSQRTKKLLVLSLRVASANKNASFVGCVTNTLLKQREKVGVAQELC